MTTADGADLPAEAVVENFPALVRLHADTFDFGQAHARGDDLRFATADGKPLAYQIESWDAAAGSAAAWVRVPRIVGQARQELRMYWGKAEATSESSGRAVFNASNGFVAAWHLHDSPRDETETLECKDTGTTAVEGIVAGARRFSGGQGIFGGDKIETLPSGGESHSTSAWFRPEVPNTTIIGWGNEQAQGKVVMQFRSPPHVRMDCYFSRGNVNATSPSPIGQWSHVVHTYASDETRIYVNGQLAGVNRQQGGPLNIRRPARLWLGGWYHNYDFVGTLDEVRVSNVARSADWVKLEYENQNPRQSLVGLPVQPGDEFSVASSEVTVAEGGRATLAAKAGGAQKVTWLLRRDDRESVVATDRLVYTLEAGRVTRDQRATVVVRAVYPDGVRTKEIAVSIRNEIPEPFFTLAGPTSWDGRQTIEVVPRISNSEALSAGGADRLNIVWTAENVAVIKRIEPNKLVLTRAQGSGKLLVTAAIDNGGPPTKQSIEIDVQERPSSEDPWITREPAELEQPEDGQFIARGGRGTIEETLGTLTYAGTLDQAADSVVLRVFAEGRPFATETARLGADRKYRLAAKLKPGLVKYRTEFASVAGGRETILHRATNIVCGDVFLIVGQSNAVANDFGKENPLQPNEWVRTFGATAGDPQGSRLRLWASAEARAPGGKSEIGFWGMELGRRIVESERIPVCIINGAVGGTRIDQHQRNEADPTDVRTIYGRMLWRVQQARLTHGVRAVIWHQGENDQGADGPTGGYGYETYRPYFVDLAAAWKQDYPNVQRYYAFQIWPKACAMGINGSDNRLREVQRTLPSLFSNLSILSTVGVKPPGGCHFPAAGYAEFARMLHPMMQAQVYDRTLEQPFSPPNLRHAYFASSARDEVVLEFDAEVEWNDRLTSQFQLDGASGQIASGQIASGAASGSRLTLKLKQPTGAKTIGYLDSANWSPDNLLYGANGLAALTFCDVPIGAAR